MSVSAAMPIFDTLEHADQLRIAGFTDAQARAQVRLAADIVEAHIDRFATKDDLRQLSVELRSEIGQVNTSLSSEIQRVDTKLSSEIRWVDTKLSSEIKQVVAELVVHRWVLGLLVGMNVATLWRVFTLPH